MLHMKFQAIAQLGLETKVFKDFYHIWALWPSCSRDPDHLYKFSFLCCTPISFHVNFGFKQFNIFSEKQNLILKSE